jgi:hypothetical protein
MEAIDLVYVLGTGSKWNNNEIRFSLRSVCKNLQNVGKIFIVGEMPGFLQHCVHVPCADIFDPAINADGNMTHKLLTVCRLADLSDDFLFMNDDFIINQPIAAHEIPWMHKEDMATRPPQYWTSQFYRFRLKRTFDELKKRGMKTMQYDYHAPMLMNKHHFISVMEQFDYAKDIGYTFRSLYGNSLELPAISITGLKVTVFKFHALSEIASKTLNTFFVGYNDQGLNKSLKWWLIDNFRSKCSYETNYPEDKVFDLYWWMFNGKQWDDGVKVFNRYYTNPHFKAMFACGETPALRRKMEYKLLMEIKNL